MKRKNLSLTAFESPTESTGGTSSDLTDLEMSGREENSPGDSMDGIHLSVHSLNTTTHSMDRVTHPIEDSDEELFVGEAETYANSGGDGLMRILIPRPVYGSVQHDVRELKRCAIAHSLIVRESIDERSDEGKADSGGNDEEVRVDEDMQENVEDRFANQGRPAPIVCTTCNTEHQESDRISWSPHSESSTLQWLPQTLQERILSDYDLSCPCCRQEFISKHLVQEPAEEGTYKEEEGEHQD